MIVCLVNSGRPHPEVKFHDLIAAVVGDAALAGLGDDTADVTAVVGPRGKPRPYGPPPRYYDWYYYRYWW